MLEEKKRRIKIENNVGRFKANNNVTDKTRNLTDYVKVHMFLLRVTEIFATSICTQNLFYTQHNCVGYRCNRTIHVIIGISPRYISQHLYITYYVRLIKIIRTISVGHKLMKVSVPKKKIP